MLRRFRDLKIATKLYCGFALVLLLLLTVAGIGISRLGQAQANLQDLSTSGLSSTTAVAATQDAFMGVRLDIANIALAPDADGKEAAARQLDADQQILDQQWRAYLDTTPASTPTQQQAYTTALQGFREVTAQLVPLAQAEEMTGYMQLRADKVVPAAMQVLATLKDLRDGEARAAATMTARGEAAYHVAVAQLIACSVLGALLAVAVAVVVARSVTRPLARVVEVMTGVAAGRLDHRVGLATRDEVGQLATSTDATITALSAAMADITTEATALATSSETLSSVSAQMASGAQQAAAQTQVVAAASEEVTVSISTVAAAGEEMTSAIAQIASATAEASTMATSAVSAAGAAGSAIGRLGTSSQEIGDVVKLITSIAEQTNLLALNATIEAARAGELGKGFAVVAGEVKELARQTAQATEEIIAKVSATQGDAAAAAAAVTEIGEVIARIDEVQATIAAAVEEQSATTSEMVRNVTEISTGSAQISANVADIAAGTEDNRGSAGQTAATATELATSASRLQELTARFTL